MHLKVNKKYRDSLRAQQLNYIKQNTRKQLLAFTHAPFTPSARTHQQLATLFPDVIDHDSLNFLQTEAFSAKQQQKTQSLIEKFNFLIENRQNLTKDQCTDCELLGGLLWNYRLIIFYGRQKVETHTLHGIYRYLKARIADGISYCDSQFHDLAKEQASERLQNYRHSLTLTLMTLISEYLNQGGTMQPTYQNWLFDQYKVWNSQLCDELQQTVKLIEDSYNDDSKTYQIKKKFGSLRFFLGEQQKLIEIYVNEKPQNFQAFLLQDFSYCKAKTLTKLMRSYQFPDQLQLLCGNIIALVAELSNQLIFQYLIQSQYLNYVKLQLILRQQYKTYGKKTKLNDHQKCTINIMSNLMVTLSEMTPFYSDLLWSEGICQEIKYAAEEIRHPQIRQDFITLVIQCIMYSSSPQKIQNEQNLLSWLLEIIQRRIEDQGKWQWDQLIAKCLELIGCFFECGNQQMMSNKLQCNPYHLQFKYLYGVQLFSRSEQCREFLDKFMPEETENCM